MSKFTSPKTYAAGEIPRSGVVGTGFNDIVTALAASINNIHNSQVAGNAAIKGSKFLDDSILATKVASKAVTAAKINATDLMALGEQSDIAGGSIDLSATSLKVIDSLSRAVLGGPVLVLTAVQASVTVADNTRTVQVWLTRSSTLNGYLTGDATVLRTFSWLSERGGADPPDGLLWFLTAVDAPAAGTYYWETYGQSSAGSGAVTIPYHHLWIVELR